MQFATKLVSTRRGTLIAALLIALLAGASILLYLNSYRDSLKAQGANVTVLVAKQAIPKGTSGTVIGTWSRRGSGRTTQRVARVGSLTRVLAGGD